MKNAEKKQAQALQLANKIKKATTDKLKKINEEHANALAQVERESAEVRASLEAEIKSLLTSREEAKKEIENLKSELERSKSIHDFALNELTEVKNSAAKDVEEKMNKITEEHLAAMLQMKNEHLAILAKAEEEHKSSILKLQIEHQNKLDAQANDNASNKAKLQKLMAKHADDLKAHYEGKFKVLKEENATLTKQLRDEIAVLNKTIESLTKELDGHRSDVEALQNLLRDRTAKEKNLLDLIDKLKQEISDSTNAALTSSNEWWKSEQN